MINETDYGIFEGGFKLTSKQPGVDEFTSEPQAKMGPTPVKPYDDLDRKATQKIGEALDKDDWYHNPNEIELDLNRKNAIKELSAKYGSATKEKVKEIQWLISRFCDEQTARHLDHSGLLCSPPFLEKMFEVLPRIEKEDLARLKNGTDSAGRKMLRFKGMSQIELKQLGQRVKELVARTVEQAKAAAIEKHGAMNQF
jgi:hypothetical protein